MSNLARLDLYKPQLLFFEMQYFRTHYVCWFSGPYFTYKVKFSTRFPLEVLRGKLRFKQTLSIIASSFYRSYQEHHLQKLHTTLSLLHIFFKRWMLGTMVGFRNGLRVRGVGYRFDISLTKLIIQAGYSHLLVKSLPQAGVFQSISTNKKATLFSIKSYDLAVLSTFLSTTRNLQRPDVYKGKGIRYQKDVIGRKEGKKKKTP